MACTGGPLFAVDPKEVKTVLAATIPQHETVFDEAQLRSLVACALSITLAEKLEIISGISKFSQLQIDALVRILSEERVVFAELEEKHRRGLAELVTFKEPADELAALWDDARTE